MEDVLELKDYMTPEKAAEKLGCTPDYVRQLCLAGTLDGEKISERRWLVKKISVNEFARKTKKTGRPRKFSR